MLFIFSLTSSEAWRYDKQKSVFFYTIDFPDYPEKWQLGDDSQSYNALFQNQSGNAFVEVTAFNVSSAENLEAMFKTITDRFAMKGEPRTTKFCQWDALRGMYAFDNNGAKIQLDLVVFKDNYFYYTVMGYSYANTFEKYAKDINGIMNSLKIYYDNGVVYENKYEEGSKNNEESTNTEQKDNNQQNTKTQDQENNESGNKDAKAANTVKKTVTTKNTKKEQEDKTIDKSTTYAMHVAWEQYNKSFQFLRADLLASKKELADIGEYTNGSWNGWKYFNIDTSNPNSNFTFWKNFYQEMYNKNYYRVNDMFKYFEGLSAGMSPYDLASTVMRCIQVIPYERPMKVVDKSTGEGLLDFFSPNEVADYDKGDCDTKSLFMVILLRRLGFDALMYYSEGYGHCMVGLNINASGTYMTYDGKKYYFVESTYPGWKIGDLPPEMNDTGKWKICPIK